MTVAYDASGRQQTVEIIAYRSEVGVLCPDCVRRMRDQHLVLEEIGEYDEWWLKIGSAELVCSSCEDELAFITNWPESVSPLSNCGDTLMGFQT